MKLDISRLESVFETLQKNPTRHKLGAKAPTLDTPASKIKQIDSSGFVRHVLFHAAGIDLPEGSVEQHEWFQAHGAEWVNYRSVIPASPHTDWFIGFIAPQGGEPGHVWLVQGAVGSNGRETRECHGGVGVGSRPWSTAALVDRVSAAYRLPA